MRTKTTALGLASVVLVALGVVLIASYFLLGNSDNTATNSSDPEGFNVPELETAQVEQAAGGPKDNTLTVTVPEMSRVRNATVPDAAGGEEEALKNYAAIHLQGTGFPWQEEANVYLAGHRLGYPGTPSFLAFYDMNNVQVGDEVYVTDADGTEYTYRVFENLVANPTDLWVIDPVPGKNILKLQTCTLPDYPQRLISRAELVDEA